MSDHPSDADLRSYGLGRLGDAPAARVAAHLEACPDCRRRAAEASSDSFLGRLRDARAASSSPGAAPAPQPVAARSMTGGPTPLADALPPGLADHPDYTIIKELGRGGMGVVYLAHNTIMGRDEVLKVMGAHIMERPGIFDRFQREIRAVARLRHPNIVAAYSAFRLGGGLVFAMEYVEGMDLARLIKVKGPLPVRHAAYFAQQAALGLQHAHERGMVHRDIKPHNLMLTHDGALRVVKILDFGLAKATREGNVDGALTQSGQALGTPDYIAPEQILNAPDVDVRADVYSLGCTLYFFLTGRPPFRANSLYDLYQAHISRDADPLNRLRPDVPSALAALAGKMMAKDPAARFQTPAEVAQALAPFLKKGAVDDRRPAPTASRPSATDPAVELTRDDRPAAPESPPSAPKPKAVAAGAASPPEAMWTSLIDFRTTEADGRSATPPPAPLPALAAARAKLPPRAVAIGLGALGAFLILALLAWQVLVKTPHGTIVLDDLPKDAVVTVDGASVDVSWSGGGAGQVSVAAGPHGLEVRQGRLKLYGDRVLVDAGKPFSVRLDRRASGEKPKPREDLAPGIKEEANPWPAAATLVGEVREGWHAQAISPDSRRVIWDGPNGTFYIVSSEGDHAPIKVVAAKEWLWYLVFSPDGKAVASAANDGLKLWDASDGSLIREFRGHTGGMIHVAFNHDGSRMASTSMDHTVRVWNPADGSLLATLKGHTNKVWSVAFSPDGRHLASGEGDWDELKRGPGYGKVLLWDLESGASFSLDEHEMRVDAIAYSPDGRRFATASFDKTVKIWDAATRRCLATLSGSDAFPTALEFSPDGRLLAEVGRDALVRVWDMSNDSLAATLVGVKGGFPRFVRFSPGGGWIYSGGQDNIRAWRTPLVTPPGSPPAGTPAIAPPTASDEGRGRSPSDVAYPWPRALDPRGMKFAGGEGASSVSPDHRMVASHFDRKALRVFNASAEGRPAVTMAGHTDFLWQSTFAPDGSRIASSGNDGFVRIWDVRTGEEVRRLNHGGGVIAVAFSPDGNRIASGGMDKTVRVWNATTGAEEAVLKGHSDSVWSLAFSPDGRSLASGCSDWDAKRRDVDMNQLLLWDLASSSFKVLRGHEMGCGSVRFSRDGRLLASVSLDKTAKLWDVAKAQCIGTMPLGEEHAAEVAFSPDGTLVAAASLDDVVRVWDVRDRSLVANLTGAAGRYHGFLEFSPDGRWISTGGEAFKTWTTPGMVAAPPAPVNPARTAPADGFTPLFNGKDVSGWKTHLSQPGDWRVEGGVLVGTAPGASHLYTARGDYKDFELRVQARISQGGNSGVLFRASDDPRPKWPQGYEAQIYAGEGPQTGSLYRVVGAPEGVLSRPATAPTGLTRPDDWFTMNVVVRGDHVVVTVNGQAAADYVDPQPFASRGHIALQVHNPQTRVEFRRIEIKELDAPPRSTSAPAAPADGFTPLFNGRDLSGWKSHPGHPANWRVEGGTLVGETSGRGYLYTERESYKDFHLRFEARINDGGNSGVFVRATADLRPTWPDGYEAQINSTHRDPNRTGSLYRSPSGVASVPFPEVVARPGEWFTMDVIAEGPRIILKVNGRTTADFVDPQPLPPGRIGIQVHNPQTRVEFRRIEIKELDAPPRSTSAAPAPASPRDGFARIFNGSDLSGWKVDRGDAASWRVEDGALVSRGGASYRDQTFLLSDRDYGEFNLRLEFQLPEGSDGGVVFRAVPGETPTAPEINLRNVAADASAPATGAFRWRRSGSGGHYLPPRRPARLKPDAWNAMEVEVRGDRLAVAINGESLQSVDLAGLSSQADALAGLARRAGRVGFQSHTGSVRIRNVEIRGR